MTTAHKHIGFALFVYGTLTDPHVVQEIIGRRLPMDDAVLEDFQSVAIPGMSYPAIVAFPGATVEGSLLIGVDERDFELLDCYEDVDDGLYERATASVRTSRGTYIRAFVYQAGPAIRDDILSRAARV